MKTEKLTLKHLAAYLPYGLKAQDIRTKEIRLVTLLHFTYNVETVGHNHLIYDGLLLSKHLPILRPLSDLVKEIEINGEKFIPLERLRELFYITNKYNNGSSSLTKTLIYNNSFKIKVEDYYYTSDNVNIYEKDINDFEIYQKLFKWHFDVFGLIDAGLAIDINKLEDENKLNK